ncbi:CPBP family intramembrane glutamic endopeptidase [Pontimicrobium sp. SW4]|uniref:CPBP family intramembrane glutamic endopeptidase n=1 Tax=Pontimicrobium sp. SW4 TaxID=3153519 RepID=A0AAU7BRX2_9FLAO
MKKAILETLFYLVLISPIIIYSLKDKKRQTLKVILAFASIALLSNVLMIVPIEYESLVLFDSKWNWSGKLYATLGVLLFLVVYGKFQLKDYYLTLKQNKSFLKKGILILLVYILIEVISYVFLSNKMPWSLDTLLYQLTMPGIQEEVASRAIIIGLLVQVLSSEKKLFKKSRINPAILVASLMFGFGHGLFLNDSLEVTFYAYPFIRTTLIGYLYGWITVKSGSILLALVSHNLLNFITSLMRML